MFLKKLIVKTTKPIISTIREIEFNKSGLSLITDITSNVPTDTGNSVGKSTVVKIIDLCLGGKNATVLYKDNDTNTVNNEVSDFLIKNKVRADLIIEDNSGQCITLSRDLFPRGKCYVNEEKLPTADDYKIELKRILFNNGDEKPSLRQLIPRFVRVENKQLENVINYLNGYQKMTTYESIHLFLIDPLNSDYISRKELLENECSYNLKRFNGYKKDNHITSESELNEMKKLLDSDLLTKKIQREKINYIDAYREELNKKSQILSELNSLNALVNNLELDISQLNNSLDKLKDEKFLVNIEVLHNIYKEVSQYTSNVNKEFQDLVEFHNTMLENRIKFIEKSLIKKKTELEDIKRTRELLLEEKQKISIELVDESLLSDLNVINYQISSLDIKKGEIQRSLDIYKKYEKAYNDALKKIELLKQKRSKDCNETKFDDFNVLLNYYSEKLYGEKYSFVYDSKWNESNTKSSSKPFKFTNVNGDLGTGKKLALIVIFDLAYLKYIESFDFPFPKFIIHDKLETTHINQLNTIFKLCNKINGQYIVPILRERISKVDLDIIDKATVLELSSNDKFFRI